ncbi:MAG: hypothetical protein HWE16_15320 [Gammaproteobacteria bacterium]|nr:hypothetical protein [Gammaproteobacteria bacterium]
MASNIRVFLALLLVLMLMACDPDPQATALSERWPKHDWSQNQPAIMVDINNDGKKERALIGFGNRTAIVSVFIKENVNHLDFVEFFIDKPNQQNSICGLKAQLQIETQKFSLANNLDPTPTGYKHCAECEGLRVVDEKDCEPFHIYWDHDNQMLSWWRY